MEDIGGSPVVEDNGPTPTVSEENMAGVDNGWYNIHALWSLHPNHAQADFTKIYLEMVSVPHTMLLLIVCRSSISLSNVMPLSRIPHSTMAELLIGRQPTEIESNLNFTFLEPVAREILHYVLTIAIIHGMESVSSLINVAL